MKQSVYSIFDNLAEVFNRPFTSINDATAIREFTQSVIEQPHKNDYELWYLGDFNDATGEITMDRQKHRIYTGLEVKTDNVVEMPQHLQEQAN